MADWNGYQFYNGANIKPVPEQYKNAHYTGTVMEQTIGGLPGGRYKVELYANASQAWIGAVDGLNDGQKELTYVYANNAETDVPVINTTEVAELSEWTLEDVIVGVDGTLTIGMRNDAQGANWHLLQIKSLTYYGTDAMARYTELGCQFGALASEECIYALPNYKGMSQEFENVGELQYEVYEHITNGSVTDEELEEVNAALENLIALISECKSLYDEYKVLRNECYDLMEISVPNSADVLTAFDDAIYESGVTAKSVADEEGFEDMMEALEAARIAYMENSIPVEGKTFDMTYKIQNAQFENKGEAWTGEPAYGGLSTNLCAEKFNTNFNVYQTITGLQNGQYEVSCQGFYRMGSYKNAISERENGTEALNALLYANEETVPLMSLLGHAYTKEEGRPLNDNWDYPETSLGYIPNSMTVASIDFLAGYYDGNKVQVVVTDGTLTLGVKKEVLVGDDWTIFDNFRLEYLGVAPATADIALSSSVPAHQGEVARELNDILLAFDTEVAWSANTDEVAQGVKLYYGRGQEVPVTVETVDEKTLRVVLDEPATTLGTYMLHLAEGVIGDSQYNYSENHLIGGRCNEDTWVAVRVIVPVEITMDPVPGYVESLKDFTLGCEAGLSVDYGCQENPQIRNSLCNEIVAYWCMHFFILADSYHHKSYSYCTTSPYPTMRLEAIRSTIPKIC